VLLSLRDGLRSGDVFVPGSRRYADPTLFLLTAERWAPRRAEYCALVDKPCDAATAIAVTTAELHTALADLDAQLAAGAPGHVRLNADGELVIPPLIAEDVPTEAEALRDELAAMLPKVPLASVLVEIDARTGFTDHLTHAGGKVKPMVITDHRGVGGFQRFGAEVTRRLGLKRSVHQPLLLALFLRTARGAHEGTAAHRPDTQNPR
jgi:hypothetical protein